MRMELPPEVAKKEKARLTAPGRCRVQAMKF
jgi:hypothetical protein